MIQHPGSAPLRPNSARMMPAATKLAVKGLSDHGPDPRRYPPRSPRTALEPERVSEPRRPSRRVRHPVVIAGNAIFTLVLLLSVVVGLAIAAGRQHYEAPGPLKDDRIVNIPRGGVRDIAELLQREGVITQPWVFIGGVLVTRAREEKELRFGEYEFKKQASIRDVVDTLVEGKAIQHQFTVPEGLTSEQVVARLSDNDVLSGNVKEIPKEGTLLPETYRFNRGMTRDQLIGRMHQAQSKILQEIWERRAADLPIKTPEQLVTLASIVEKETGRPEERSRVAAVFVNRLRAHMRLQSDPTIVYGLVGGQGTLGHPIARSEIEQPTPYNTYVIDGLPPGPIANPGRASLEAAANPARTKELYFVADGTGGHAFSETLDQHQKNVGRLRQLEHQKDAVQNPPAPAAAAPAAPARNNPAPPRSAARAAPAAPRLLRPTPITPQPPATSDTQEGARTQ